MRHYEEDIVTFTNKDGTTELLVATKVNSKLSCVGCVGEHNDGLCERLPRCHSGITALIWKEAVC